MKEEKNREFKVTYCPKSDPCKGCHRDFDEEECGYCDNYLEALAWNMKESPNEQ